MILKWAPSEHFKSLIIVVIEYIWVLPETRNNIQIIANDFNRFNNFCFHKLLVILWVFCILSPLLWLSLTEDRSFGFSNMDFKMLLDLCLVSLKKSPSPTCFVIRNRLICVIVILPDCILTLLVGDLKMRYCLFIVKNVFCFCFFVCFFSRTLINGRSRECHIQALLYVIKLKV